MVKDQEFLKDKATYCLDLAKKIGATDASVTIGHSISETVNFRNKNLDESNTSYLSLLSSRIIIASSRFFPAKLGTSIYLLCLV